MKRRFLLFLTVLLFAPVIVGLAQETTKTIDPLSQMLFDEYIARRGKINSSTVVAATHIVAERGHNTGFWRVVLSELQRNRAESEMGCVNVLGKMLQTDASARNYFRRAKNPTDLPASVAPPRLGPEVVRELVARGEKADRFRVDAYAIALARAQAPEAADCFRMILRDDYGQGYVESAKFHAAVGLAQLGNPAGFEWLIANIDKGVDVSNAWPIRTPDSDTQSFVVTALRQLTGEKTLKAQKEWQIWWDHVDKKVLPKNYVGLVDP